MRSSRTTLKLTISENAIPDVIEDRRQLLISSSHPSLLCSRSRGEARLSARSARPLSAKKGHSCAELGAERETTVDQTLIRGLVTAFRVFVSGLSSV